MLKEKSVVALKDNKWTWTTPEYYKRIDENNFVTPDCTVITEEDLRKKIKETYEEKNQETDEVTVHDHYTLVEISEFEFNGKVMDHISNLESELAQARVHVEKIRRMFGVG